MRTPLDEIVDAFFPSWQPSVYDQAVLRGLVRAALDHAFQHGVERAYATNLEAPVTYKSIPWIWDIQPAPAEEKPCRHAVRVGGVCAGCNDDRRKGQRRRAMEWKRISPSGNYPEWGCTFGNTITTIGKEQRSGDRRKP